MTVRDKLFGPDDIRLTKTKRDRLRRRFRVYRHRPPGSHDEVLYALTDLRPTSIIRPLALYYQVDQLKEARTHADYHFTDDKLKDIPCDTWSEYANQMVALASQILPVTRQLPPYP